VRSSTKSNVISRGYVVAQLDVLVPVAGLAITLLNWDFSVRWFASFASIDRHQPEQRRNRRLEPMTGGS
jgi:hypothetical protein